MFNRFVQDQRVQDRYKAPHGGVCIALDECLLENGMRKYFFIVVTLFASASTFNAARPAKAQTNPVCRADGGDEQGGLRCEFANFDQCRATTSGTAVPASRILNTPPQAIESASGMLAERPHVSFHAKW
jgi:hypothetical protein